MSVNKTELGEVFNFGDYAIIEQKRHGAENEMYLHKVIGRSESNTYVDIPVQSPATETTHSQIVEVVSCICCGVVETTVRMYRVSDVKPKKQTMKHIIEIPTLPGNQVEINDPFEEEDIWIKGKLLNIVIEAEDNEQGFELKFRVLTDKHGTVTVEQGAIKAFCRCTVPLVRNDGREYCGNCGKNFEV